MMSTEQQTSSTTVQKQWDRLEKGKERLASSGAAALQRQEIQEAREAAYAIGRIQDHQSAVLGRLREALKYCEEASTDE